MLLESLKLKENFYYKFISIIGIIFVLLLTIELFFNLREQIEVLGKIYPILFIKLSLNIISLVILIATLFFPKKLELYSIISFLYSFFLIYESPENLISIILFFWGIITLAIRGFFRSHAKNKFLFLFFIYFIVSLTNIQFGKSAFLKFSLDRILSFLLLGIIVVFTTKQVDTIISKSKKQSIDMTSFKNLTEDDKKVIQMLLLGEKYESIAKELKLSTPAIKKRIKKIFITLRVPDLIGFHAEYNGRKLIFEHKEHEL